MNINFHKSFKKKYKKLRLRERRKFDEKLKLFEINPFDPFLNNHPLCGKFKIFRSINITGDFRAIYSILDRDSVEFVDIDTHSNLYS